MRVDSNPPINVSRPLAVQSHNPAPHRDVCLVVIRMRAQSFQNFSRKAILKLQDQLSQHDRCKKLNQRHLSYARRFKSINQRIATIGSSKPQHCPAQGCLFGRDTLIGGFESTRITQMPLVEFFAPVMLRKLVL